MGILDNDTVIVDAILTKVGRQKLANGQPLGVTQYAFGDTELIIHFITLLIRVVQIHMEVL